VQNGVEGQIGAILPESRSVLCIPSHTAKLWLGALNIESRNESAFFPQDVLILNTLADCWPQLCNNAFVFQKLQQQSITDGLTGIKTRRFFWEAFRPSGSALRARGDRSPWY